MWNWWIILHHIVFLIYFEYIRLVLDGFRWFYMDSFVSYTFFVGETSFLVQSSAPNFRVFLLPSDFLAPTFSDRSRISRWKFHCVSNLQMANWSPYICVFSNPENASKLASQLCQIMPNPEFGGLNQFNPNFLLCQILHFC